QILGEPVLHVDANAHPLARELAGNVKPGLRMRDVQLRGFPERFIEKAFDSEPELQRTLPPRQVVDAVRSSSTDPPNEPSGLIPSAWQTPIKHRDKFERCVIHQAQIIRFGY